MLSEYEFAGVGASVSGIPSDLAHGAAPSSGVVDISTLISMRPIAGCPDWIYCG